MCCNLDVTVCGDKVTIVIMKRSGMTTESVSVTVSVQHGVSLLLLASSHSYLRWSDALSLSHTQRSDICWK